MSSKGLLSIVVPTHNTRTLVRSCLESIPSRKSHQIIVVDDASEDQTAQDITARFPEVTIIRHDSRKGFSAAVNTGLRRVEGEIILLLNSDTRLVGDGISALDHHFQGHTTTGIIGAHLVYPDGGLQWSGGSFPSALWLFALTSGLGTLRARLFGSQVVGSARGGQPVDWVSGAAMAIRRSVFEDVGFFDEGYSVYAQDLDYCRRAAESGWTCMLREDFKVIHEHGATISRSDETAGRARPAELWNDLLRYVANHDGEPAARRARRVMRLGAFLRILARSLVGPLMTGAVGARFRKETRVFRRAATLLSRNASTS